MPYLIYIRMRNMKGPKSICGLLRRVILKPLIIFSRSDNRNYC